MSNNINTIEIKTLNDYTSRASNNVIDAIELASKKSGVDFSYLVQQASAESNFNPNAQAKTSSASGLYQFIDSTWLNMVERYSDDYGLNIKGKTKNEILDMRKDPKIASFMAAAFASENEKSLNRNWGGDIGATELYFAHFLGAGGASSFLKARDENPLRPAADLFPKAAHANRNVFYDSKNGDAKTLDEVYQFFANKFQLKDDDNINKSNKNNAINIANKENLDEIKISYLSAYPNLDSIIMQRSYLMRENSKQNINNNAGYGQIQRIANSFINSNITNSYNSIKSPKINNSSKHMPFFTMITKPVDIMLLTQTETPHIKPYE